MVHRSATTWRRCWSPALLVIGAMLLVGAARAAEPAPGPPGTQSAPLGSSDNKGGIVAGQSPPQVEIARCNEPSGPEPAARAPITITVNPATAWQPRGGTVIVALNAPDAALLKGLTIRACFGWSEASAEGFFTPDNLKPFREAFVGLRPSDPADPPGTVNFGVTVPRLGDAPSQLHHRWFAHKRSAGFGIVPVASMRLIGYNESGKLFDTVRPVGVTSLWFAVIMAALIIVIICAALYRIVSPPRPDAGTGRLPAWLRTATNVRWLLWVIRGSDGYASLSAFQILLWTMTIVASAVYVMALSGNLINITAGTLTVLGIAGGAGLLANAIPPAPPRPPAALAATTAAAGAVAPQTPAMAASVPIGQPAWADLIRDENDLPDVTRLQMLVFTGVSAAFVLIQVLNTYVIPDIPPGYQILMGISNGIYVGRKFVPSRPAAPPPAAAGH